MCMWANLRLCMCVHTCVPLKPVCHSCACASPPCITWCVSRGRPHTRHAALAWSAHSRAMCASRHSRSRAARSPRPWARACPPAAPAQHGVARRRSCCLGLRTGCRMSQGHRGLRSPSPEHGIQRVGLRSVEWRGVDSAVQHRVQGDELRCVDYRGEGCAAWAVTRLHHSGNAGGAMRYLSWSTCRHTCEWVCVCVWYAPRALLPGWLIQGPCMLQRFGACPHRTDAARHCSRGRGA